MRKPDFCLCEIKGGDLLFSNCTADGRLCYTDSTIPLLPKIGNFKLLAVFWRCTDLFVLDLVENPEDQFSHDAPQMHWAMTFRAT